MNGYAIIILALLLVDYVVHLLADYLNLKALRAEVPKEFAGIFDADTYRRSQEYTRVYTRFALLESTFFLGVTLAFWFSGGFPALDRLVRGWEFGPIGTGLAYIGILLLGRALLSLPFKAYATFGIEERFGFNRTSLSTFLTDLLKGLFLALVLGGPLLAGILAFFASIGPTAWLYCWGITTLFTLGIQFIAPTWILPLFNKFQPLPEGPLKEAILSYTRSVHFPVKEIMIMDGSRRSSKSNAFFTGWGKQKRIALFDTLVEKHPVPELVAILAHEVGHYKKKHLWQNLLLSILHQGVLFFLLSLFLTQQELFAAFYMPQPAVYTGLIFFGLLYTPIETLLAILLQALSRRQEYAADRFAVETTHHPEALIQALQKLSVHNLANLTPHPFYVLLHYSHPPILERIKAIERYNDVS
ncbi:MAG: M48 family peptidase [Nitrospinota bacterium]|nr:MAG: M48 family peptidase [Nitrospinota bacterium]